MKTLHALTLSFVAAASAACVSNAQLGTFDSGGPGPDGGPGDSGFVLGPDGGFPPAFAQFCSTFAAELSANQAACGQWSPSMVNGVAALMNYYYCDVLWGPGLIHGTATFDPTAAAACVAALQNNPTCDAITYAICLSGPVRGTALTGQRCYSQTDCAVQGDTCSGTGCNLTCQGTCLTHACQGDTWCNSNGACSPPLALGAACPFGATNSCGSTAYCSNTTQVCTALPGSGQPCLSAPSCVPGFYCPRTGTNPVCTPDPTLGQACNTFSLPCAPGTYCGQTQTCAAQVADGGTCTPNLTGECDTGLVCNQRLTQCLPQGWVGAPCGSLIDCQRPLVCDLASGQCAVGVIAAVGEPCDNSGVACSPLATCVVPNAQDGGAPASGTCQLSATGTHCMSDVQCPIGSSCQSADGGVGLLNGICTATAVGSPCTSDFNCPASEYCAPSTTGFSKCAARIATGQSCTSAAACPKGEQCLGNPGVCTALGDVGATCTTTGTAPCLGGLGCINGTCTDALGNFGASCATDAFCAPSVCVKGVCLPLLANGQSCGQATECISGSCVGSVCVAACP